MLRREGVSTMTRKVSLVNAKENHRKFYVAEITEQGGVLVVKGTWGRIGCESPASQVKYLGNDKTAAEREFNEVLRTRAQHGYDVISDIRVA